MNLASPNAILTFSIPFLPSTTLGKSKIVCTIGPACWNLDQLETLIESGMNVARFNFSHGDHATHAATLERVRQAARNKERNVGE